MNRDATPADRELVYKLFDLVEGLPKGLQVKLFHDLHGQVHTTAKHYRVTQRTGYEEALRQATRAHILDPSQTNLKLLWIHRRES